MITKSVWAAALAAGLLWAQSAEGPRGQWKGSIESPRGAVAFVFDIDKTEKGWVGSMGVPTQNVSGIPLSDIREEAGEWKFNIAGGPSAPSFAGKLLEGGKVLDGTFSQGGGSIGLKLTHAGDPKVELPKPSPALAKEFLGEWEGTLEGPNLRLLLKVVNAEGGAKAQLTSIDQGGVEIPATSVQAKEKKLTVEVRAVDGGFTGELSADASELKGDWTQRGQSMPLTLKKKAAAAK